MINITDFEVIDYKYIQQIFFEKVSQHLSNFDHMMGPTAKRSSKIFTVHSIRMIHSYRTECCDICHITKYGIYPRITSRRKKALSEDKRSVPLAKPPSVINLNVTIQNAETLRYGKGHTRSNVVATLSWERESFLCRFWSGNALWRESLNDFVFRFATVTWKYYRE